MKHYRLKLNEVEVYEAHHCAIINKITESTPCNFDTEWNDLNNMAALIEVVFQPYDKEYEIQVTSAGLIIHRLKDDSRLGIIEPNYN